MAQSPEDGLAEVLDKRPSFLRIIVEQPRSKRELETDLDCSRSTLDRATRDLADAGLVEYEDGVWRPTLLGRYCHGARDVYVDCLDDFAGAAPLLDHLPSDCPIDRDFLAGVDAHEADSLMPSAVLQTMLDSVGRATEVCVASPVVVTGFIGGLYDRVRTTGSYSVEILLPSAAIERVGDAHPGLLDDLRNDASVSLLARSVPFTFGLWIADAAEAGVVPFFGGGVGGILVNDTDDALDWATGQYERTK